MGEVKYSINGKYFKDYGIYVSSSLGLLDALKRKPIKTYDWAEYHGESLDLTSPKFEAREIVLNCFIKGDNYQEMFDNFRNVVLSEFQKSGTQRLLVEPFGYKALPFEVYLSDEVKIAKEFSESTSIGVFSIKLIEPNPIKKVLYTTSKTLNLSYNSSKETEIFFVNGEKTTAKGNVSISNKTLANRNVSGYNFNGRNLLLNSKQPIFGLYDQTIGSVLKLYKSQYPTLESDLTYIRVTGGTSDFANLRAVLSLGIPKANEVVSVSFKIKNFLNPITLHSNQGIRETTINVNNQTTLVKWEGIVGDGSGEVQIQIRSLSTDLEMHVWDVMYEKGNKATDWTPAPEDERYIIIAGDIDGITNLTTNATLLWEKL